MGYSVPGIHRRPQGRKLVNLNRKPGCSLSYSTEKIRVLCELYRDEGVLSESRKMELSS